MNRISTVILRILSPAGVVRLPRHFSIMRWRLLATLLFLLALAATVRAGTSGDFTYSTNNSSATILQYTGTDQYVSIPVYIADVKVETIGNSAFSGCTNLILVNVPYTVTNLGSAVFEGCTGLVSAVFQGDAPTLSASGSIFNGVTNVTVYHWSGAAGWGPTFSGQPATVLGRFI